MKRLRFLAVLFLLTGVAGTIQAEDNQQTLVVTASNAASNQLLVYDTTAKLVQMLPTGGQGGAGGNGGGIAIQGNLLAVVNFGSQNVSIFRHNGPGFQQVATIHTASKPLSLAFGRSHLYVLGTTTVESHRVNGGGVQPTMDGMTTLLKADGSSAQVGVVVNQLIITEKSNVIETVNLNGDGAVSGSPTLVQNIPANVDAPFGLVTRGGNAYVTIAHADEVSLVRNGKVLTTTGSGGQHAPCWGALDGPFLFISNTGSMTISRFAVYGQKIVLDAVIAANTKGGPSDIDAKDGLVAVVDAGGGVSHISVFNVDEDGNLTLRGSSTVNNPINGVVILRGGDTED